MPRILVIGMIFFFLVGPQKGISENLTVQVRDSETGAPVEAVVLAVGAEANVYSERTDAAGVAVLELPSLEDVSVTVRTDSHGVKCFGPESTISGNLSVQMRPSLRLYGILKDHSGRALKGGTGKVVYKDDPNCRVTSYHPDEFTNERGEYVLRNIDLDRDFWIVFRHDEYVEHQLTKEGLVSGQYGAFALRMRVDVPLSRRP